MCMAILIRKATENDIPAIHRLVIELAAYEQGLHKVTTTPESYLHAFRDQQFNAFVADRDGNVIGMALFFRVFSTWKGPMLYLEDFVVREPDRGAGIGKL